MTEPVYQHKDPGYHRKDAILFLLEVHEKGVTTPEMVAYLGGDTSGVRYHLNSLEEKGLVHSTPVGGSTAKLWHLTPGGPQLTPLPPARLTRSGKRAHIKRR